MAANHRVLYSYYPYVLSTIQARAEQHEKDIYHELREAKGETRTRITSKNNAWKDELKALLNMNEVEANQDVNSDAILNIQSDIIEAVQTSFKDSTALSDFAADVGIRALINSIRKGGFVKSDGKFKPLNDNELQGLRKELLISIQRYNWAKDLSKDAVLINTVGFDRGAYSEGKLDIAIKLNTRETKQRQIRTEVKNYTDIHKIASLDSNSMNQIARTAWTSVDPKDNAIVIHLNSQVIEDVCNNFLLKKYKDNLFPFIEDGNNIILFSEFIENLAGEDPNHALELRTYTDLDNFDKIQLVSQAHTADWYKELEKKGKDARNKIARGKKDYTLWYGKK